MLNVEGLTYNDLAFNELNDLNLELDKGEVGVVIGPNGSGKSLLLKALAEPHLDYSGRVTLGHFRAKSEPEKVKAILGYIPKPVVIEPFLTGFELLETICALHNIAPKERHAKILKLATDLGCNDFLYNLLERLGPAMHQKLAIIASLIHQPNVILWDEPLVHLDYSSRMEALNLLRQDIAHGATVLIATNDLALAEEVADKLFIMKGGEIIADGTLKQIHNQIKAPKEDLKSIYQHLFGI